METQLDEQIEEIMYKFDFEKVATVMRLMNWCWATTEDCGVPTVADLRRCARSLLYSLVDNYSGNNDWRFIKTGGLAARISETTECGPVLELSFEIETWTAC